MEKAKTALAVLLATLCILECKGDVIDTIGGRVKVPSKPLDVTMWPGDATRSGFEFPELSGGDFGIPALQQKPNFGIGVSGGGLRATTLAVGWLRGMHRLGLLKQARYLGSASGGTMANVLISYTDPTKLKARFDRYIAPENATIAALKDLKHGTFLRMVADMENFYQTFLECLSRVLDGKTEGYPTAGAYTRAISQSVLAPFGLQAWNSTVTAAGTRGRVHERIAATAKELGLKVYTAMQSSTTPFPLISGNVFDTDNAMPFFPIEFTPLYFGSPGDYRPLNDPSDLIGGGLMEPLGFNAKLVDTTGLPAAPGASGAANTTPFKARVNSSYVTPLASQVAVSGGILAVELNSIIQAKPGFNGTQRSLGFGQPFFEYTNLWNYKSNVYPFADGGYIDNEGLWSLLRRKVKKVLIFYSNASPSQNITVWSSANTGLSLPFGRCEDCYEYLKVPTNVTNQASKVFKPEEFDDLFNTYHANVRAGRVNVWRKTLDVHENKFMGVPGGWQVDLMVVMNAVVDQWEQKLPAATRKLINDCRKGDSIESIKQQQHPLKLYSLVDFPFFAINIFRYNKLALGALSQAATWQVLQLKDNITAFINGP